MAEEPPFYLPPKSELCQGDIVRGVPHLYLKPPVDVLRERMVSGERKIIEAHPTPLGLPPNEADLVAPPSGGFRFHQNAGDIIRSPLITALGIVLTYGCEIDNDRKHCHIALIRPLRFVQPDEQKNVVRENRNFAFFHLPAHEDNFEESYVDLRRISTVHPDFVRHAEKVTSLADDAVQRLLVQFFLYITGLEADAIDALMKNRRSRA